MKKDIRTRTYGNSNFININGRRVDLYSARIVYRCEECHAPLNIKGAGLKCSENSRHRGFIHRNEVTRIQETQAANVNQLGEIYQIVDGKVTVKQQ